MIKLSIKFINIMLVILILSLLTSCSFSKKQNSSSEISESSITEDSDEDEEYFSTIDAEEYISSFGTIVDSYNASESESMLSEKQVIGLLSEKGFSDCVVYSHYTADGEYYDSEEISADSDAKHPNYDIQYIAPDGAIWSICVTQNTICAIPISYIMNEELEYSVYYIENNLLFFYDNVSDKYYEVENNSDSVRVIKNFEITAETLNNITSEEVGKL